MTKPLRMLTVIGARPQIIKAAAMSRAIAGRFQGRIEETLLHTGQHYDANMSQVFFDELGIPRADIDLAIGSGAHGAQTARMMEGIEHEIMQRDPDLVLLYGDTNSTLAGALAASKLHVPVAHVEAGLRSFNKRMPEEVNRVVCDHCSTWLFCPTSTAVDNLVREGFSVAPRDTPSADEPHIQLSGDVMFDNSMHFAKAAKNRRSVVDDMGLVGKEFILVTLHRNTNTDVPERLNGIFRALLDLHARHALPLVMPLHPRARKMMDVWLDADVRASLEARSSFHVLSPAGFLDMIALESNARLIITDSGGVQREAFFFGKPCVILRPETEWVELVAHGQAVLADADPHRISIASDAFLRNGVPLCPPLFGDGRAAEHICSALLGDR